jgi:hypothetical protein
MKKKLIVIGIIFLFLFSGITTLPTIASQKISIKNFYEDSENLEARGISWAIYYCRLKGDIKGYHREGKYKEWVFNCTDVRIFGIILVILPPLGLYRFSDHAKNKQINLRNSGFAEFFGELTEDYVNGFLFYYDPLFR